MTGKLLVGSLANPTIYLLFVPIETTNALSSTIIGLGKSCGRLGIGEAVIMLTFVAWELE
jgi:hypothetical protein